MITLRLLAQLCFIITSLAALILCPHSKVEESFQLQATHDLFYHGISPAMATAIHNYNNSTSQESLPYDHLQYPGVVPRTFGGPFLIAYALQFFRYLLLPFNYDVADHPMLVQFLARLLLWWIHVQAWFHLARALDQRIASVSSTRRREQQQHQNVGTYLLFITASQFHIPFYASRMLPNTFALILVLYCYTAWFRQDTPRAASWLVLATTVIRCDLLLLLFTVGLSWLITRQLTILQALRIGIITGIASLALTTPLDSLLWNQWRQWVWPEGQVFWFNTVLGKSKEWGVLPWHWYVSTAIPKAMLATLGLVPLSVVSWRVGITNRRHGLPLQLDTFWMPYLLPIWAFIGLYSLLGHKEMRFLFPAMPMINLAAAVGLSKLHDLATLGNYLNDDEASDDYVASKKHDDVPTRLEGTNIIGIRIWVGRFLWGGGILAILLTLLGSLSFLAVSTWNYPGGVALSRLIQHVDNTNQLTTNKGERTVVINVHVDVAAAMSGVSLFGQRQALMNGSHRGRRHHQQQEQRWIFDKAGYEEEHTVPDFSKFTHLLTEQQQVKGFHVVDVVQGKPRLDIRRLRVVTQDAIFILERNGWK